MPIVAHELTDIQVRKLTATVKKHFPVGGVSGLYIQVTPSFAKSWVLRTMIGNKRRHIGLGSYPEVTLKQAREKARAHKQQIAEGTDPLTSAKERKSALNANQAQEVVFKDLARRWVAIKQKEWATSKQVRRVNQYLEDYVYPHIGNLLIRDIQRPHIVKMLVPIWEDKNPTARRLINYLEAILQKGIVEGLRTTANPAVWKGNLDQSFPKSQKIHKVVHQRSVDWQKMPAFIKDLYALNFPKGTRPDAMCLAFVILTVSRPSEARLAEWDEIDLNTKIWTIPADRPGRKSAVEWKIPLCDASLKILKSLPNRTGRIFNTLNNKEIPDNYLSSIPKEIGYEGVAHGFRTTFRTWTQDETRFTEEACELTMKHLDTTSTRAAYARSQLLDDRREILNTYEKWLFKGNTRNPNNIVSITEHKRKK